MAKPALYTVCGGIVSLSDSGIQSLLRAVLAKDFSFRFRAEGSSMSPFIQCGDAVVVSPRRDRTVRTGDVVAFCDPPTRKLTIHRVVASRPDGFVVRGDNTLAADGLICHEDVLGVVSTVQRNGRRIRFGLGPERCLIAHAIHHRVGKALIWRMCHGLAVLP